MKPKTLTMHLPSDPATLLRTYPKDSKSTHHRDTCTFLLLQHRSQQPSHRTNPEITEPTLSWGELLLFSGQQWQWLWQMTLFWREKTHTRHCLLYRHCEPSITQQSSDKPSSQVYFPKGDFSGTASIACFGWAAELHAVNAKKNVPMLLTQILCVERSKPQANVH